MLQLIANICVRIIYTKNNRETLKLETLCGGIFSCTAYKNRPFVAAALGEYINNNKLAFLADASSKRYFFSGRAGGGGGKEKKEKLN